MFLKLNKNSTVQNILVITLSNIGDALLSAPSIDILLRDFPNAKLSVLVGPRAASAFEGNSHIHHLYLLDKTASLLDKLKLIAHLKKQHFDLVVDFRHTVIGFLLFPKWVTPISGLIDKKVHLKERHLNRLRTIYNFNVEPFYSAAILPSESQEKLIDQLLNPFIQNQEPFVAIAPIAADSAKTWLPQGFIDLGNAIGSKYGYKIVLLGSQKDQEILEFIKTHIDYPVLNLAGRTNLLEAGALLKRCKFAVVHDSGPMHIASYFNKPAVALFGPTNPKNSQPWGDHYEVVHKNAECARCINDSTGVPHTCMSAIKADDVMKAIDALHIKMGAE